MVFVCKTCKKEYKTERGLNNHVKIHEKENEEQQKLKEQFDLETEEDFKCDSESNGYYETEINAETDDNSFEIVGTEKDEDEEDNKNEEVEMNNKELELEDNNDEVVDDSNSEYNDENDWDEVLSENGEVELVRETVNLYRICDVENVFLKIDQIDGNRKKLKEQLENKINLFNQKINQQLNLINKNKQLGEKENNNLKKDLAQLKTTIETEIKTGLTDQKELFTEKLNELAIKMDESLNAMNESLNDQIEQNKENIEILNDQVESNNDSVNDKIDSLLKDQKNNFDRLSENTNKQFDNIKDELTESFKKTNQDINKLKETISEFNSQNLKLSKLINLSIDQQTKNEIELQKTNEKLENINEKMEEETENNKKNFELVKEHINCIDLSVIETNIINQVKTLFEPIIKQQSKHEKILLKLVERVNQVETSNSGSEEEKEEINDLTIEEKVKTLVQHMYNSSEKDKDLKRYIFKLTYDDKSFIGNGKFKLQKNIYKKYDDVIHLVERTGLTSNDFEFEVIHECLCKSSEEANILTDMYIDQYDSIENGYNLNYYSKKYKKIKELNVKTKEELIEVI